MQDRKGKLQVWRNILEPTINPVCRFCEVEPETGRHVALTYTYYRGMDWETVDRQMRGRDGCGRGRTETRKSPKTC